MHDMAALGINFELMPIKGLLNRKKTAIEVVRRGIAKLVIVRTSRKSLKLKKLNRSK